MHSIDMDWNCDYEASTDNNPDGKLCEAHKPINIHREACDHPDCLICHPEQIGMESVRDMFFWTLPADCCGRPRLVCTYEPCLPPRENEITRSGFDYDFAEVGFDLQAQRAPFRI